MKNFFKIIILIAYTATIAGCGGALSIHPITSVEDGLRDNAIEGLWEYKDEKDHMFVHVGRSTGINVKIIAISHTKNHEIEESYYTAYPSKIREHNYLNLQISEPDGTVSVENSLYILIYYKHLDQQTIQVSFMEPDFIKKKIEMNELSGTQPGYSEKVGNNLIKQKNYYELTGDSKELRNFIIRNGPSTIFKNAFVLKRMR
jgi:hypothetical protein